jgi:hypothetical protein
LFKSTDAGATWIATGLTQATVALAIAPVTSTIYAGTSSGLFKSTDGGTIWSTAGVSGQVCSVEIDPAAIPTTLYASLCSQIIKGIDLGDLGVNWRSVGPLEPISSVAIAAGPPLILYAWDGGQVFSSRDGGVNWSGGDSTPVIDLSIDPMMPTTVYVNYYGWGCTNDYCFTAAGINKSTDGGASWIELAQLFYADTWVSPSPFVSQVAIDPLASSTVYAAWSLSCDAWDLYCAGYGIVGDHWISKSTDGGASWLRVSDLGAGALWFDPLTRTVLYATTYSGDVLQSTDGGVTWSAPGTTLTSLSLQPTSAPGGSTSTGTVTLSATGGAVMTLSSSDTTAATVPASVTVLSPSTTVTFPVTTKAVTTSTTVTITVTLGGDTRTATLTVNPPPPPVVTLASLSLQPTSVSGGHASTGTVTLSAPAPAGDAVVTLSSSNAAVAAVPASVIVPAGAATVGFTVSTTAVASAQTVTISAMSGGVIQSAALTVTPPPDTSPPDTSIISAVDDTGTALANNAATLSASLTLTFSGADNVGLARFECRLDGAAFNACTSPQTYNGLALGPHTFEVRAVDTSSNVDATPARYTWTVDAAPETTITSAVDGRGKSIANGGSTPSDRMTFRFTGTDNGAVTGFECQLDGLDGASFAPCTSPISYPSVSRGTHTFRVRANDNNGFWDASPAAFTWRR